MENGVRMLPAGQGGANPADQAPTVARLRRGSIAKTPASSELPMATEAQRDSAAIAPDPKASAPSPAKNPIMPPTIITTIAIDALPVCEAMIHREIGQKLGTDWVVTRHAGLAAQIGGTAPPDSNRGAEGSPPPAPRHLSSMPVQNTSKK